MNKWIFIFCLTIFCAASDQVGLIKQSVQQFSCGQCGRLFDSAHAVRAHASKTHALKEFVCNSCGARSTTQEALSQHMAANHREISRAFACLECHRSFDSAQGLKNHTSKAHTRNRSICCDICGQTTFDKRGLSSHKRRCHNSDSKPFKCPYDGCLTTSRSEQAWKQHKNLYHSAKNPAQSSLLPSSSQEVDLQGVAQAQKQANESLSVQKGNDEKDISLPPKEVDIFDDFNFDVSHFDAQNIDTSFLDE